jgi:hypothetical protein
MRFLPLTIGIICLSCVGCQVRPLKAELIGFSRVVSCREDVNFKIRLRNISPVSQPIPTEFEVRYCSGFAFVAGIEPENLPDDFRVDGPRAIDLCPPSCEMIGGWGIREYQFRWQPPKNWRGEGTLVVQLQEELPAISPFAIRIE